MLESAATIVHITASYPPPLCKKTNIPIQTHNCKTPCSQIHFLIDVKRTFWFTCDLQARTRGLDILRTLIISEEITHTHDLCKSLTMYSKLKFFYRLKIVSFTCHQPKDIINVQNRGRYQREGSWGDCERKQNNTEQTQIK